MLRARRKNENVSQAKYINKNDKNPNARGYGQVEPNHLSAQATKEIYAQLPCAEGIDILENGQFAKYDYAAGEVNFTGEGDWFLVLNEIKLYEPRETDADWAMKIENYTNRKSMVPRLFATKVGDIYTTNMINATEPTVGMKLTPDANGILTEGDGDTNVWKVVKIYTMPDMQPGVKLQRIA